MIVYYEATPTRSRERKPNVKSNGFSFSTKELYFRIKCFATFQIKFPTYTEKMTWYEQYSWKFSEIYKILCYKDDVKFNDIYHVFE